MKYFLLFLFLTPLIYGQDYLEILTDTTELKEYDGSGLCLLEKFSASDYTGGGLFIRMDSAYAEGTHAFDYPYDGYQWVRLPYIGGELSAFQDLSATSIDLTGDVTLENDEIVDNGTDGDVSILFNDDAASLAQIFAESSIDTPNIADNDNMELIFKFNDDSSGLTNYGTIKITATDVSDESEDSKIELKNFMAGSEVTPLTLTGSAASVAGALTVGDGVVADGYAHTGFSTLTLTSNDTTANTDTLKLASNLSDLIKVRSSLSNSDSVDVITGGISNQYYQFRAVHTDTTITFVDGAGLILGASRVLDGDDDLLILFNDGTKWVEVSFISNE